jgi:hypothetical protein
MTTPRLIPAFEPEERLKVEDVDPLKLLLLASSFRLPMHWKSPLGRGILLNIVHAFVMFSPD